VYGMPVFDKEVMEVLVHFTRDLPEEILETLDILADDEMMEKIREGEEDVKKGRVRSLEEFLKDVHD